MTTSSVLIPDFDPNNPTDIAWWSRVYRLKPGETMGGRLWREFEVLQASRFLDREILDQVRPLMEKTVAKLDHYVDQAGGPDHVIGHLLVAHLQLTASHMLNMLERRIMHRSMEPVLKAGIIAMAARSKGGRSKPKPKWHEQAVRHARTLQLNGMPQRYVVGACASYCRKSDDAVRRVLRAQGLISSK